MTAVKSHQIIFPTGEEDRAITAAALADPDAHPLTEEQLAGMQSIRHFVEHGRLHVEGAVPGRACMSHTFYKNTASLAIRPCLSARPEYVLPEAEKKKAACIYCAHKRRGGPVFCKRKCIDVVFDPAGDAVNKNRHKLFLADAADLDWARVLVLSDADGKHKGGLGLLGKRVHFVAFIDKDDQRRIISLRRANLKEARHYHNRMA